MNLTVLSLNALVRLGGSSVDNGGVELFSDALLGINTLLILPSD